MKIEVNLMVDNEWLRCLNIGDTVAFNIGRYGHDRYVIDKVNKITSGGKIKTRLGYEFNKYGVCKVDQWHSFFLQPVTDEIMEQIKREKLLKLITEANFSNLTTNQLEKIAFIMQESKDGKHNE